MRSFTLGARVKVRRAVLAGDSSRSALLFGRSGTVTRLRHRDEGAFVALDARYSSAAVHFFHNPKDSRYTHVLTYPEWCDEGE